MSSELFSEWRVIIYVHSINTSVMEMDCVLFEAETDFFNII